MQTRIIENSHEIGNGWISFKRTYNEKVSVEITCDDSLNSTLIGNTFYITLWKKILYVHAFFNYKTNGSIWINKNNAKIIFKEIS